MRFVLMLESQQGLSYARSRRDRPTRGGERLRGALPLGPLPELSGTDRPADDGRLDGHGRARPGDRADRARGARVADDLPPPGIVRQGRDHGRRDERRPDRGRRRGRLARARAPAARPAVPADQGAGRPDGGHAGHPPGPVGRTRRLDLRGSPGLDPRRPVPSEAGRCPRPAADGRRRRPAAAARRRGRLAPLAAHGGALRGRVQPELLGTGPGPGGVRRRRRGVRGRSGATRRRSPIRRWPAC